MKVRSRVTELRLPRGGEVGLLHPKPEAMHPGTVRRIQADASLYSLPQLFGSVPSCSFLDSHEWSHLCLIAFALIIALPSSSCPQDATPRVQAIQELNTGNQIF